MNGSGGEGDEFYPGGAIAQYGVYTNSTVTLNVKNSTFDGNSAAKGGAIMNWARSQATAALNVENCIFNNNISKGFAGTGFGGAIANSSIGNIDPNTTGIAVGKAAELKVTNSVFKGNKNITYPNSAPVILPEKLLL